MNRTNRAMKARTLFWPLLRHATGIDQIPRLAWSLWLVYFLMGVMPAGCAPLLILLKVSQGDLATLFTAFAEVLGFVPFLWLALAGSLLGAGWMLLR